MFKWKRSEAAPETKTDEQVRDEREPAEREHQIYQAAQGSEKIVNLAHGHLKSLVSTIKDQEQLARIINDTELKLKDLGQMIEAADQDLVGKKKVVAEKFSSLSATFTALCEKVKQGSLPTTALATDEAQATVALQHLDGKKEAIKVQQKAPGT